MDSQLKLYKQQLDIRESNKKMSEILQQPASLGLRRHSIQQVQDLGNKTVELFDKNKEVMKLNKIKIKYAKEFFINEKGEVIKMAAIETSDAHILQQLRKDAYL